MKIREYQSARYPFLWLSTTEEERTIRAHRAQLKKEIRVFSWDIAAGFRELTNGTETGWTWKEIEDEPTSNPGEALTKVLQMPEDSIYYLKDFHKYFTDITVIRRALNIKESLKATARLVCFMACRTEIPPELKNDITPYIPPMPSQDELKETVTRIAQDNQIPIPQGKELDAISNALIGLTEEGAENALSLVLVQSKTFDVRILIKEKSRLIEGAGLTYSEYSETLDDLAGNEVIKGYILKAAPKADSSSILEYGIPGTGKSHIAKAIGNALKWPVISFDLSGIRTKYQGETEGNLERALSTIEAIGRCIVFCDEVDKAIAGAQGGADADAGTGARIIGRLLRYFADRKPGGAYWIFTANSLQDILTISGGALVRRFDAMFFLDMPTDKERRQIVKIWARKMSVEISETFDTQGMTGADIAKLARTMRLLDCTADEARKYIIPTKQALGTRIDDIRNAAKATCIPAGLPETTEIKTGRKLDL
jgi:hypothetical protein